MSNYRYQNALNRGPDGTQRRVSLDDADPSFSAYAQPYVGSNYHGNQEVIRAVGMPAQYSGLEMSSSGLREKGTDPSARPDGESEALQAKLIRLEEEAARRDKEAAKQTEMLSQLLAEKLTKEEPPAFRDEEEEKDISTETISPVVTAVSSSGKPVLTSDKMQLVEFVKQKKTPSSCLEALYSPVVRVAVTRSEFVGLTGGGWPIEFSEILPSFKERIGADRMYVMKLPAGEEPSLHRFVAIIASKEQPLYTLTVVLARNGAPAIMAYTTKLDGILMVVFGLGYTLLDTRGPVKHVASYGPWSYMVLQVNPHPLNSEHPYLLDQMATAVQVGVSARYKPSIFGNRNCMIVDGQALIQKPWCERPPLTKAYQKLRYGYLQGSLTLAIRASDDPTVLSSEESVKRSSILRMRSTAGDTGLAVGSMTSFDIDLKNEERTKKATMSEVFRRMELNFLYAAVFFAIFAAIYFLSRILETMSDIDDTSADVERLMRAILFSLEDQDNDSV